MDRIMDQSITTKSWTFWNIEPPTKADEEASQIPSQSVSNAPEDAHESICLACAFKQLREDSENMQAELYDLRNSVQHLIQMLGGK